MWKPYLKVVAKKAGHALHILDRFHIAMHMSEAIEAVRRAEVHDLRRQGRQPLLTKTRWLLLKRRDHRTPEERGRLRTLVRHNLKAVRTTPVSYTHLRAHETRHDLVCRLLLEKKKKKKTSNAKPQT